MYPMLLKAALPSNSPMEDVVFDKMIVRRSLREGKKKRLVDRKAGERCLSAFP